MSNFKGMSVEEIKKTVEEIYNSNPRVHINLNLARKKLSNVEVLIKSVHPRFFIIEHDDGGYIARYTVRYDELLTSEVEVLELFLKEGDI